MQGEVCMEALINTLLSINFYELDTDDILKERNVEAFKKEWLRVFNSIEMKKNENTYSAVNKEYTGRIRENVFGKIYRRTGDSELAEIISDDFVLIADSFILGYKDNWLDKMIECYGYAVIPAGEL